MNRAKENGTVPEQLDPSAVDARWMARALELARQGEGMTRPNPPVGAVLVQDGVVRAEGFHAVAGGAHAEQACLKHVPRGASGSLRTAVLYVTLEPCSTHGRTPPCTELILQHGIGRVVVAVRDPNPRHAGRGIEILRAAGVEVQEGVGAEEAQRLIAPFAKRITTGMPYVTLKLAMSLDGKIADRNGASKWITGPAARERVQVMRRRADAIVVGAGTVRADNPSLLPRPDEGRTPWRVIIGTDFPEAAVVRTDHAADRTLVRKGPLPGILRGLAAEQEVMHLLCEGGGKLAASLLREGLVDELVFFYAPKLLGAEAVPGVGDLGTDLASARTATLVHLEQIGPDLLVQYRFSQMCV